MYIFSRYLFIEYPLICGVCGISMQLTSFLPNFKTQGIVYSILKYIH